MTHDWIGDAVSIVAASPNSGLNVDELGVTHVLEEYYGAHRNRVWGRTWRLCSAVLPWFSLVLDGDRGKP